MAQTKVYSSVVWAVKSYSLAFVVVGTLRLPVRTNSLIQWKLIPPEILLQVIEILPPVECFLLKVPVCEDFHTPREPF